MTDKSKPVLHIEDAKWLRGVREDLDSKADVWVKRTPSEGVSKLEAIAGYLDTILTELGHQGRRHACPDCGIEHMAPVSR